MELINKSYKELAKKQLPAKIINLPKKGFSMPLGNWMRKDLKDWTQSIIFDDPSKWEEYLNKTAVKLMWNQHQSGQNDHSARLWEIVALELGK